MRSCRWGCNPIWLVSIWEDIKTQRTYLPRDGYARTQVAIWANERGFGRNQTCWHFIQDLYPSEIWENKFVLFKRRSLWYFVIATLTSKVIHRFFSALGSLLIYTAGKDISKTILCFSESACLLLCFNWMLIALSLSILHTIIGLT